MRCFGDFFEEKNIDVDVFDDVLKNAKKRANDASNDVNRPPLSPPGQDYRSGKGWPQLLPVLPITFLSSSSFT